MSTTSGQRNSGIPFQRIYRLDILIVSLTIHCLALALPLALLQIYDRILPAQSYGTAAALVTGVGLAIALETLLRFGRTALFANIGARYEAETTMRMLDRLQHVEVSEIENRGTAVVNQAFRSIAQVRDFWSGQAGMALYELPFVAIYIALIAYIGGWLAIIPVILFAVALAVVLAWTPSIGRAVQAADVEERKRQNFAWSILAALDYLKATGVEGTLGAIWRRINSRCMSAGADLETRMGWVRENATAFGQLSTILIVAFGAAEVVRGDLTTGALSACSMLAGRSIGPAMASLAYWTQLPRMGEAMAKVNDILNLKDNPALRQEAEPECLAMEDGEIRIEAPDLFDEPVSILPGEVVHLDTADTVLASRLLTAVAGMVHDPGIRVTFAGCGLNEYSQDRYRESVMLVTHQLALVPGSILNNLTLYDPRYNAAVQEFSELLGLQEHMDKLRHGVLTEVGPGTAEHLDEGIYQRIAIIRALLRRPAVLLLDHAARGIDLDGIKRLAELLKSMQGKTTILISTFKPPLIEACTRSLKLELRREGR